MQRSRTSKKIKILIQQTYTLYNDYNCHTKRNRTAVLHCKIEFFEAKKRVSLLRHKILFRGNEHTTKISRSFQSKKIQEMEKTHKR